MGIEDIDVIQTHALQALVEAGDQIFARSPLAVGPGPHVVSGLGGDDEFVAITAQIVLQNLAERFFGEPGGGP